MVESETEKKITITVMSDTQTTNTRSNNIKKYTLSKHTYISIKYSM